MNKLATFSFLLFLLAGCKEGKRTEAGITVNPVRIPDAISLFGDSLFSSRPSEKLLKRHHIREIDYNKDSVDADNIIWYGRFEAYKGDYADAIAIFSRGIDLYPNDARFYRHRGHRYITVRKFDKAIADFEKAVGLIANRPNEVEPDGMPNARNIPVSTLHGNIYYHLGLAHYLNWNLEDSLEAYKKHLAIGDRPDTLVSATHWVYMILRLLNREEEAVKQLEPIKADLDIIENTAYHQLCLFYKGESDLGELGQKLDGTPGSDAIKYGIANWYFYNGEKEMARKKLIRLLTQKSWNSFGYIAAESQLKNYFRY